MKAKRAGSSMSSPAGPALGARSDGRHRSAERVNVFDAVVKHIADQRAAGAKVLITAWTEGSLDRLLQVLDEHGLARVKPIERAEGSRRLGKGEAAAAVLSLEAGFETGDLVVIGEQDILGDRMVRRSQAPQARRRFHLGSRGPRRRLDRRPRRTRYRPVRRA